jgi:CubicO group peptidase (beta-lactamase class C family)
MPGLARYLVLVLSLFYFGIGYAQHVSKKQKKTIDRIETYLNKEFPSNEPGCVVLIAEKGAIIFKKAFGLSNLQSGAKMTTDEIMPIASMSKQFTAASILKLAEQNKISLSDPLQKYIPEFPAKKYTITIENLLAQTSGIREYFDIDENERGLLTKEFKPTEVIDFFKNDSLEFEPGKQFRYSNSNYFLLGLIIERVSGKPYGQFLNEILFEPLKMTQSAYWYNYKEPKANLPQGYMYENGQFKPATAVNGSLWYSSGGITSTVNDLYTWNTALMSNKVLTATERMLSPNKLSSGENSSYAFGLFTRNLQGSPTLQHGGNLYGFTSSGLYLPREDVYVAILCNRGLKPTEEMANYLASEIIEKPISITKAYKLTADELKTYTGTYQLVSDKKRIMKILIVSDRLVLSQPAQPGSEVDIVPLGNDKFVSKKVNAQLLFLKDDKGNVISLQVNQKGLSEWKRISD